MQRIIQCLMLEVIHHILGQLLTIRLKTIVWLLKPTMHCNVTKADEETATQTDNKPVVDVAGEKFLGLQIGNYCVACFSEDNVW